jgi:WD40 repeat protein
MKPCPAVDQLRQFLADDLPTADLAAIDEHIESCPTCQATLERMSGPNGDRPGRGGVEGEAAVSGLESFWRRLENAPPGTIGPGKLAGATTEAPECPAIPSYEILRELGRGGMGVVYLARQIRLDRLVALKMLRTEVAGGSEQRARFGTEVEAAARLQHPNIVQIFEVGEHDGRPFFAMEWIEGSTLAATGAGPGLPVHQAAEWLLALARAVHYAHQRGVVHRDLKPANVLLRGDGVPKITDFGLAKRLDCAAGHPTQSGAILGTPSYMAPEQADARAAYIGPATDVYGLGAILYYLLTGVPPFQERTLLETLEAARTREPVPPARRRPGLARDLETICLKCLDKEPPRRYSTADAMADDLGHFLRHEPIRARPVGPLGRSGRWCRRNPALAVVSGLALALAMLAIGGLTAHGLAVRRHAAALFEQGRQADRRDALQAMDDGLALCEEGEADQGLLWLAQALGRAVRAGADDLEPVIRSNLADWQRRLPTLRAYLEHAGPVEALAYSPDGRLVATGAKDGARLWLTATGQPASALLAHPGPVTKVHFPADGKALLTVAADRAFRWDIRTNQMLGSYRQDAAIQVAVLDPAGDHLFLADEGGGACLWDVAAASPRAVLHGHAGPIRSAVFSADGRLLLTGGADQTARLWDAATGRPRCPPWPHQGPVWSVAFSSDGRRAVTGSEDETARRWDTASGQPIGPPLAHGGSVQQALFSPDGSKIITGCRDWKVRHWDAATGQPLGPPLQHQAPLTSVAISADGQTILTASWDGKARLWEAATGELRHALSHPGGVRALAWSRDGQSLVTATGESAALLWTLPPHRAAGTSIAHPSWLFATAFSPDGQLLATGGVGPDVRLWETATGRPRGQPMVHRDAIRGLAFTPDGALLATAGEDHYARLWRVDTGQLAIPPLPHPAKLTSLALSPDGRTLATGTRQGSVFLWRLPEGDPLGSFAAHREPVWALAFSPDGGMLASASADQTARLWRLPDGVPIGSSLRHQGQVWSVAFRPDGRAVATGSQDKTVRLWESATALPLGAPLREHAPIRSTAFTPDGHGLVVGDWNGLLRIWDPVTRKPLSGPRPHGGAVLALTFAADGSQLRTAAEDQRIRAWPLPTPLVGRAEELERLIQASTGMRLDADGAVQFLDAPSWRTLQGLGGNQ